MEPRKAVTARGILIQRFGSFLRGFRAFTPGATGNAFRRSLKTPPRPAAVQKIAEAEGCKSCWRSVRRLIAVPDAMPTFRQVFWRVRAVLMALLCGLREHGPAPRVLVRRAGAGTKFPEPRPATVVVHKGAQGLLTLGDAGRAADQRARHRAPAVSPRTLSSLCRWRSIPADRAQRGDHRHLVTIV